MKLKKLLSLLLCVIMVCSIVAGCGGKSEPAQNTEAPVAQVPDEEPVAAEPAGYAEEVAIGIINGISTMNPQETNLLVDKNAIQMTHDTLVVYGEDGSIQPSLATDWEMVDDVTWIFNLRKGAKFHNGEEVKASDVVFSFQKAKEAGSAAPIVAPLVDIVAEDDYTVKMTLTAANVDWLSTLYDTRCSIVSEKACTELGNDEGSRIGSGPYKFVELVLNDHLTIEKFDEAWDADSCPTQRFVFKCIPENSARLIALQTGEIDICNNTSANEVSHIEEDENLNLIQVPSNNTMYIGFNTKDPLMSNKLLRQAISYALDREEIVLIAENGMGETTRTWWAKSVSSRYDGFDGHVLDLDKAKELMAEAGYPDGFDLRISINQDLKTQAETIQAQLKKININVTIDLVDSSGFIAYINDLKHQCWMSGYNFSGYSDNMRNAYYTGSSGGSRSAYSNSRVDELYDLAVAEPDEAVRNEYYKEIQEIIAEECTILGLYYQNLCIGTDKNLQGAFFREDGHHTYKRCYVAE